MRQPIWEAPNKMRMNTGNPYFDQQTNVIGYGPMATNTQLSTYVRSIDAMDQYCMPRNYFQNDVSVFNHLPLDGNMASSICNRLASLSRSCRGAAMLVYAFFNREPQGVVIHGFVVTDEDGNFIDTIYCNSSAATHKLIHEVKQYVGQTYGD